MTIAVNNVDYVRLNDESEIDFHLSRLVGHFCQAKENTVVGLIAKISFISSNMTEDNYCGSRKCIYDKHFV